MPRKKPFSNKQKKQQLQKKRMKKRKKGDDESASKEEEEHLHLPESPMDSTSPREEDKDVDPPGTETLHAPHGIEYLMGVATKNDPKRFSMYFNKESKSEIDERKRAAATIPITSVSEREMEVGMEDVYGEGSMLDLPRRPPWTYSTTKEELNRREMAAFDVYLRRIHSKCGHSRLSYFEHNLETWRQLWRVLEISDVILLIADIRHPALHFSPALYSYVVEELKKKLILVLNKVDLVPPQVGVAWRHYFLSKFRHLDVICFTSYPSQTVSSQPPEKVKLKFRRRGKIPSAVGPEELLKIVEKICHDEISLDEWKQKLVETAPKTTPSERAAIELGSKLEEDEESSEEEEDEGEDEGEEEEEEGEEEEEEDEGEDEGEEGEDEGEEVEEEVEEEEVEEEGEEVEDEGEEEEEEGEEVEEDVEGGRICTSKINLESVREGVLTIGMVGHPNVGKSSIINALMTKKVVSTSRTPGHTKHFQTIFLTPSLRLCDCPGLVFPSLVDKQLQILSGLYPVAQVREPFTGVGYLAQRVPLVRMLQLIHPDHTCPGATYASQMTKEEHTWTAWDICDAWAYKRGYYTSRAARPDTYRAANSILRLAVDGRICMYYRPPGFSESKAQWEVHPEVAELSRLQQVGMEASSGSYQLPNVVGERSARTVVDVSIKSPEQFASLLCRHFMSTYQQVVRVKVYAEQAPWQRIKQGGMEHYHAFILEPSVIRFCTVSQLRGGTVQICAGLKDMKIFKPTQSGFKGFVRDQFTSLPDVNDRAFCSKVYLHYDIGSAGDGAEVDYNDVWEMVKSAVLDVFAGPPYTGAFSPSIKKTMYDIAQLIFNKIPEITSVDIMMPNLHYFMADLTKINIPQTRELLLPSDTPYGRIAAKFTRKTKSHL